MDYFLSRTAHGAGSLHGSLIMSMAYEEAEVLIKFGRSLPPPRNHHHMPTDQIQPGFQVTELGAMGGEWTPSCEYCVCVLLGSVLALPKARRHQLLSNEDHHPSNSAAEDWRQVGNRTFPAGSSLHSPQLDHIAC